MQRRRLRFFYCIPSVPLILRLTFQSVLDIPVRERNYTILARGDKKKREGENVETEGEREIGHRVGSRIRAIYLTITNAFFTQRKINGRK